MENPQMTHDDALANNRQQDNRKPTETARDAAASALSEVKDMARTVTEGVTARAADTMAGVRDAAGARAEAARDSLVQTGDRLAESLVESAEGRSALEARLLNSVAGGITSVTDGLRGQSLSDLVARAEQAARRHPGAFVAGAAVAGFMLARFLRSSSREQSASERAMERTERFYRDAARNTADTLGTAGGYRS